MADLRDTGEFGWTTKQVRAARDLADLEPEIVTRDRPSLGPVREGTATTTTIRVATAASVAVRVRNTLEDRVGVFGLDGSPIDPEGWHAAGAAEIDALKRAGDLLDRWADDPTGLRAAGLID